MFSRLNRGALLLALLTLGLAALAQTTKPTPAFIAANNAFGFHLYAALAKTDGQRNLFISPLSIEYALTMTANGARGETFTQMANTLGWKATPLAQVNAGFHALTKRLLIADPKVQIALADSLWLSKHDTFRDAFLHANQQYFGAEMRRVSFGDPATVPAMNAWVKEQTHGMIPKLVEKNDVDSTTPLVLLNALYFKGRWSAPFDPNQTSLQPFTAASGAIEQVKMMGLRSKFQYFADDKLQVVKLPYGNGSMSMLIFLPRSSQKLKAIAGTVFTQTGWARYAAQLTPRSGLVQLPRFQADYSILLNDALKALGMTDAFAPRADFSGIDGLRDTWIKIVRHKTVLEVGELGTEAAAATQVSTARSIPLTTFTMTVDHPFLFAIQQQDGTLLFLGSISKPE